MRRQKALTVTFCLIVAFGLAGAASASLINMDIGGDPVVYDDLNNLYWYPVLSDFTGSLDDQLAQIDALDYGGTSDWRMASWTETSVLKVSLASMATEQIMPTAFGPDFGTPVIDNRDIASPFLAWNVDSKEFFTPTATFDFPMIGALGMDVFNGRTNGWGMTNTGAPPDSPDLGFWGDVVWTDLPADDHWVAVNLMNVGDENLTMIYNFDQHWRLPGDTMNPVMGPVGAWAVAEPIPEPATMLLFGTGLASLAGVVSRRRKK